MVDLIPQIEKIWKLRKNKLEKLGEGVKLKLERLNQNKSGKNCY